MVRHVLRVHPTGETTPRAEQLAWKLAAVAADDAPLDQDAAAMAVNRIVDNAAVSLAALARRPVANARAQAVAHPHPHGATVIGLGPGVKVCCEWAAWANATAVRELDFHDTFLAADMNHPGDMIPALVAVAQQRGLAGADLVRAILTAYEVDVALTKAICLNKHRIDHITHLAAGTVAGLGDLLRLPVEVTYQAVNHAVHVAITTRQSRKGEISSWKAYAPAHVAKLAIEAVDRAMRGESGPAPIYEGDDSIVAWLLDGPEAAYEIDLPEPPAARRAILETYTKAHSAEYQAQALIDLAFRLRERIDDVDAVREVVIHTSDHTHRIIGNGANDPQNTIPRPAGKRSITAPCTSSPWRWPMAPGTTTRATPRSAPGPSPRSCNASARWKTPSGPGAIMSPIRRNAPSAPAPESLSPTARCWRTNSPSPTPTRTAPGPMPATTTSPSSAPSAMASSSRGRAIVSWIPR